VVTLVNRVVALWSLCVRDSTPELADAFVMKRLGGAHEDIVATVRSVEGKLTRHLVVITNDVVGLLFRCTAGFLRSAFDVDAVFVGAGQEVSLDAALSLRPRDRVSHDHRVEMTEMRQAVGVVNWCSDVESVHQFFCVFVPFCGYLEGFLANSSPGLKRGFSGLSEIILPIANAISPSWIIAR